MSTVRLLSYNVRSLRDDRAALARVIRACAPDVVCVQEMPRFARWRALRRRFSGSCGLAVASARRPAGLAVLAAPRVRVLHSEYHLLSRVPRMHRRGLALAIVEVDGRRLGVASTHLDLAGEPRRRHVGEVLDRLEATRRAHGVPVVLAGDINEQPHGPAWGDLAGALQDAYATSPVGGGETYSSSAPRRRIDGVFADHGLEVVSCGVPSDAALADDLPLATDHLPLLAVLRLPDTGSDRRADADPDAAPDTGPDAHAGPGA